MTKDFNGFNDREVKRTVPKQCMVDKLSSRICEKGTFGCDLEHSAIQRQEEVGGQLNLANYEAFAEAARIVGKEVENLRKLLNQVKPDKQLTENEILNIAGDWKYDSKSGSLYNFSPRGFITCVQRILDAQVPVNRDEPAVEMVGDKYRIVSLPNGYEPQMLYNTGVTKEMKWFPLNESGYWLEPDAFNMGEIERHMVFTHEETAREVIRKAQDRND